MENQRFLNFFFYAGSMYCIVLLYSQGCFLNNIDCYDQPKCVEKREEPKKALMFCCCEGDMCNRNFTWEPVSTHSPPSGKLHFWTLSSELGRLLNLVHELRKIIVLLHMGTNSSNANWYLVPLYKHA